jgi:CHRD domain
MRARHLVLTVLAVLFASALLVPGAIAGNGGAPRVATLSGTEQIPPGDPDGSGFATVRLNPGQGRVCWDITVENIAPALAAHIHAGAAGVNGPIVVPFSPPTTGSSSGCTTGVDPALIRDIISNPDQYYVNVHNAEFLGGAIRGQLSNRGQSDGS